ncbi:hypothetical protein [Kitasatospora sp. NPDC058478]|uniref:hypothetical protein n=1 Tax=unclassified Kitasatospora TaxID=2633591 RepID=UPI003669158F
MVAPHRSSLDPVELWVDDRLLDSFDRVRSLLAGVELGRHPHPDSEGITVVEMQMEDAPMGAVRMELTVQRVPDDFSAPACFIPTLQVKEIAWFDENGHTIK